MRSSFRKFIFLGVWIFLWSMVALWGGEIYLYLQYQSSKERVRLLEHLSHQLFFDQRSKVEVVKGLKDQGSRAAVDFSPWFFIDGTDEMPQLQKGIPIEEKTIFPLSGVSRTKVVLCNESGQWAIVDSDEYGFNNPPGLYEGNLDVLILGDSFVAGSCVPPDSQVVSLVRQQFPRTLGLGKSGNGPLAMLATFKEYARELRPKIVLWFYFEENDLNDLNVESRSYLKQYLNHQNFSQNLKQHQERIDRHLLEKIDEFLSTKKQNMKVPANQERIQTKVSWYRFLRDVVFIPQLRQKVFNQSSVLNLENLPLFKVVLSEVKNDINSWQGQLYVVYLPAYDSLRKRWFEGSRHERLFGYTKILSVFKDLNIPVIDLYLTFKSAPDPLNFFPFRQHNHYNEAGYRLMAEAILKRIHP